MCAAEPFDDLLARDKQLPLPSRSASDKPVELVKLFIKSPGDLRLKLTGGEPGPDQKPLFTLSTPTEKEGLIRWEVIANDPREKLPLAIFTFEKQSLLFAWTPRTAESKLARLLRYSLLRISIGSDSHECTLLQPVSIPPVSLDLAGQNTSQQRIKLKLDPDISLTDKLALELDLPGAKVEGIATSDKRPGVRHSIRFVGDISSSDKLNRSIELDVALAGDGKGACTMTISPYVYLPSTGSKKSIDQRTQLNKHGIEARKKQLTQRVNQKTSRIKELAAQVDDLQKYGKLLDQGLKQAKAKKPISVQVRARGKGLTVPARIPNQNADLQQQLTEEKNAIPGAIADLNSQKAKLEEDIKDLENGQSWCDDMLKQFDTLQSNSRFHFKLVFGTGGDQVTIAQTQTDTTKQP
ncbi:MAG: hypothetical protein U0903_14135 [Planctomycetales bacterium]